MIHATDMPKLESPYVREMINNKYIVTPEINPGYEWVFEDENINVVEKLDGTNVSIYIQNGIISNVWNRTKRINRFTKIKQEKQILEAIQNSYERGYLEFMLDGQHFGEAIGGKIQGNPYKIKELIWLPFETYCRNTLNYTRKWLPLSKDFESISEWMFNLNGLYASRMGNKDGFVEGVVFVRADGKMAKLRRDMFDWYKGRRH